MTTPATLVLADGTLFNGVAIGKEGQTIGEVLFNTAMMGYQEVLTDPASAGQLIAFTYPHIGNSGVNNEDNESDRVVAAGLIIRDLPLLASNFRSEDSLDSYLRRQGIVGIADIDTRRLTRHLRREGSQIGGIITGDNPDMAAMLQRIAAFSKKALENVCDSRSIESYEWHEGVWHLGKRFQREEEKPIHVVVLDLGVTRDALRHLFEAGCRVTVVPATATASDIIALKPNGVFISNGAGDPTKQVMLIAEIKRLIDSQLPLLAVGLGYQLLGLSLGGKAIKLPYGLYSVNHPVQDIATGKVMMTTQRQDYILLAESLPQEVLITHCSLVDQSVQGLRLKDRPISGFQGALEGDATFLFEQLIDAMWAK